MPSSALDTDLRELFENRRLLDRVVRGIALDQGASFVDSLEHLHAGVEAAWGQGQSTLRDALAYSPADVDAVDTTLTLLERRDQAVERAFERAGGPMLLEEQVDQRGLVLLDQSGAETAIREAPGGFQGRPLVPARFPSAPRHERAQVDVGKAIADPVEFENRLIRMRAAHPTADYAGDDGREAFRQHDRIHLSAGRDMVRSAERNREIRAAQAAADRVGRQLDAQIAEAAGERQKLMALDTKLAAFGEAEKGLNFDYARQDLRSRALAAAGDVKMLDQLDALEQAAVDQAGEDQAAGEITWETVQTRMRALDRDQSEFLKTLDEMVRGEPLPAELPTPEPESPAHVHPESHALYQRVQDRMRELDSPPSDYPNILEQLMQEGL